MEIPPREGYDDGRSKHYTPQCEGCQFYRLIDKKDLCGKGKGFAYLFRLKHRDVGCTIIGRVVDYRPSAKYLDQLILRNTTADDIISGKRSS